MKRKYQIVFIIGIAIALLIVIFAGTQIYLLELYEQRILSVADEGSASAYYNATDESYVVDFSKSEVPTACLKKLRVPTGLWSRLPRPIVVRNVPIKTVRESSLILDRVSEVKIQGGVQTLEELEDVDRCFPNAYVLQFEQLAWNDAIESHFREIERPISVIAVSASAKGASLPEKIGDHCYFQWFYRSTDVTK